MTLVVDNSVVLAWLFKDEFTEETKALFARAADDDLVMPSIWLYELSNQLARARSAGRITAMEVESFIGTLRNFVIELAQPGPMAIIERAVSSGLSAYDAAYLEIAAAREVPLATLDRRLRAAAKAAGVELLPTDEGVSPNLI